MTVRYHRLDYHDNVRYKFYFIALAVFAVLATSTFTVLCVKRQYGEYRGPFFPGVCECWWETDGNAPVPTSLPTNAAKCGPKKLVFQYINSTPVFSGYIQYCSMVYDPTPSPTVYHPTPFPPTPSPTKYNPTPYPTLYNPTPYPNVIHSYKPTHFPTAYHPTPSPTLLQTYTPTHSPSPTISYEYSYYFSFFY